MTQVEFHFDFGSPNAYLSHVVIPAIEQRTGGRFAYVPVLLGGVFKLTNNQSPVVTLRGIRNKAEYQELEMQRFIRRHGIERFRPNPHFPVNTLLVMRGAVAAELEGVFRPYVDAVFRAMWEEQRKVDDPDVARAVLDDAGIDGARLLARAQEQEVKDRLLRNTQRSVERGTFGSPTFFVADEIFFGKDRLRDVEEAISQESTARNLTNPEADMSGRYLEDFAVGQTFGSGRLRLDKERIKTFAAEFDPQPFHLDEEAARDTIFQGLAASGWHTAALTMRLLVESELRPAGGIVGAGFDEFRWPVPARPGDELRVESEVLEVRPSKSRPSQGLIKLRTTTLNQNGEAVQIHVGNLIVRRRST